MQTILVSNRIAEPSRGGAMPGGLAAALYAATDKNGAWWIGSSGKFTKENAADTPINMKSIGAGKLVTVDFPANLFRNFYNGMSNSAIWPILHDRADLLHYDERFFGGYSEVNDLMADAVARIAQPDALIWIHDYHFFMLGDCLRRRGFDNPIGFFLHTPFPTASVLGCLPQHQTVMKSLAAYDLVGFQTGNDLLRFRDYATTELAATLTGQTSLRFGKNRVQIGVFPIGINVDHFAEAAERNHKTRRLNRMRHDLHDGSLVIGVDRLDYSKGLPLRFQSYEQFLTLYPEERKRVSFLQITPPTRSEVESYRRIRGELAAKAGDINARFGSVDWQVLRYVNESFSPDELAGFYRMSKVGCVTPLRDGMNLVAKEYIAAQDAEDPGVLVLSRFAGAAAECTAAILVNPYDPEAVATSIAHALSMPLEERRSRHAALFQVISDNDLNWWGEHFLAALTKDGSSTPWHEQLGLTPPLFTGLA
jgi:trehalose 6-phosphate synthase